MFSSLTVIIPTYNRRDVLAKALAGYLAQAQLGMIRELLVVDDGSTDDTESMVREYAAKALFPVRYLRQANRGPAAARNYGIREAQSNLVLFTDSDIIPNRDLVEEHIQWHDRNPQMAAAVLGYVTWSPEVNPTPFMRWYGDEALFAFRRFRGREEIDCRYFYSCNLSLKTEYLRRCGQFDEDFKDAAYEDVELGYRLKKKGLRLLFNRDAVAYHHQFFSFEQACRKAQISARGRWLFEQKDSAQDWLAWHRNRAATTRFQIASRIAGGVATVFGRSRRLPDSRFPLPRIIYHCLFWHRVNLQTVPKPVDTK